MKISVSALFKRMIGMAEAGLDAGKSNVIIHKETEFYSTDYNPSALLGSYDTLTITQTITNIPQNNYNSFLLTI